MGASRLLARLAAGNVVAATPAQLTAMIAATTPVTATVTVALAKLTPVTGANGSLLDNGRERSDHGADLHPADMSPYERMWRTARRGA